MKRNLFAAFLAVALVMALVFVVAPDTKATTGADHTFTADGQSYEVKGNCVIDLAGFDVSITVADGLASVPNVVVIDSKNLEDMTGASAGTLAVNGNCNINDVNLNLVDSYRYLKVDNGGTYSFYPFNMAITKYGVHAQRPSVSLELRFVANKVVQDKLTGYGIYKHDGANANLFANVIDKFEFEDGKYGLRVCFDLKGSLTKDMVDETRHFSAYMEIGGVPVIGEQRVAVKPSTVLTKVNSEYSTYTGETRNLAKILYLMHDHLRTYLPALEGAITQGYAMVTDVNDLKAGDKIVIVARDSAFALSTDQKTNNRGQAAVNKGNSTVTVGEGVQVLTLEKGAVDGTFAFNTGSGYLYAASSGSNHLKTQVTNDANGSWKITIDADGVATIVAQGTNTNNTMQYNPSSSLFACYASATQKAIAIYKFGEVVKCDHDVAETKPTCETDGKCALCGYAIEALGHSYTIEKSHECANGCGETSDCDYVGGKCTICDTDEPGAPTGPVTESMNIFGTNGTLASDNSYITWTSGRVTFTNKKGGTAIRTSDSNHYRIYANSKVTISVEDGFDITTIVLTISESGYVDEMQTALTSAGFSFSTSGTVITIDLTSSSETSISFTPTAQTRVNKVDVTYAVACEHTGGTATCTEKKECTKCGNHYGELAKHTYVVNGHTCDFGCGTTTGDCTDADSNGTCDYCGETVDLGGNEETQTVTVSKDYKQMTTLAGVSTSSTGGSVNGKNIKLDENITVVFAKGGSTSNPAYYTESIRLYQNGGTLTVKAAEGCKLETIVITVANNSSGKGPISVTGGTASALTNLKFTITVNEGVSEVVIKTTGTSSSNRLYVANIEVTYEK